MAMGLPGEEFLLDREPPRPWARSCGTGFDRRYRSKDTEREEAPDSWNSRKLSGLRP